MQARRRASEVGGWLEDSLCNSSASSALPPTSVMSLQVSLSLLVSLSHSVQFIIQSLFLSLSFYNLPHTHLLSLSLSLSFSKLSFPVFYWSCNPTPLSFSLSARYHYWYKPRPIFQAANDKAEPPPHLLQIHTHTHKNMYAHMMPVAG